MYVRYDFLNENASLLTDMSLVSWFRDILEFSELFMDSSS